MRFRQVLVIIAVLFALAVLETSVLPKLLGNPGSRPNLMLIVTSVWAAIGAPYALIWAFVGGAMLDVMSAAPLGVFSFSLMLANLTASLIEFVPIPVQWFRVGTWVAIATVVAHTLWLFSATSTGHALDVGMATANVAIPLLLLNPVLSLPIYPILSRAQAALSDTGRVV